MAAVTGKKGKKKSKPKTLSLNEFLGDAATPGVTSINWADEADDSSVKMSLSYQSSYSRDRDAKKEPKKIQLPTAPRASRQVELDLNKVPDSGPFTAFLGNLPYEVNQEMLEDFFQGMPVLNVRLPEENGRFKGFGYIEFADKGSLIKALQMNEETLQKRTIRIDIADNQTKDVGPGGGGFRNRGGFGGGGFGASAGGPDPTEGNWRRAAKDDSPLPEEDSNRGYGSSGRQWSQDSSGGGGYGRQDSRGSNYDRDRGFSDRDRGFSDRDRGFSDRRYDSRDGGGGFGRSGSRDDRYQRDYGSSRDSGFRRDYDPAPPSRESRERRVLKLQPRQKPIEEAGTAVRSSSIFGDAKPVDTTAREREIEEKIVAR